MHSKEPAIPDEQQLMYRRQFILGPRQFRPNHVWKHLEICPRFVLSAHADIEVVSHRSDSCDLVLIGWFVDPARPEMTPLQLLEKLASSGSSLAQLIEATTPLSGRWALLYHRSNTLAIFHDPCGLRQVFYHYGADGLWCGSQPEIIRTNCVLQTDSDGRLQEFLTSERFQRNEGAWIGPTTPYRDCFHLQPNHYLDLHTGMARRFFPNQPLLPITCEEAIEVAGPLLQGSIAALVAQRRPLMLAVTGGWDSRILLASARDHLGAIRCYVDRMGAMSAGHVDVQIPLALSRKLGFRFVVENSDEDPPRRFFELLRRNVTNARNLPKTRAIYSKLARGETAININGNVSGICKNVYRAFYFKNGRDHHKVSIEELAKRCKYPGSAFVKHQLEQWISGLPPHGLGYELLDMLYWEQRMGNWGAQYPAELDIAVEEFSPFNNRHLLTSLLAAPAEFRLPPNYSLYAQLIRHLWPATLAVPINAPLLRQRIVEQLRSFLGAGAHRARSES